METFLLLNREELNATFDGERYVIDRDDYDLLDYIEFLVKDDGFVQCSVIPDSVFLTRRKCYFRVNAINESENGTDSEGNTSEIDEDSESSEDLATDDVSLPQSQVWMDDEYDEELCEWRNRYSHFESEED